MNGSNNDIYVMIISVAGILLVLVVFIVSFLFIYSNRQKRHRTDMETTTEKYNAEILKTQLEIKEQTLKYIAEEIHDNVGQVLSLVVLNLSAIELADKAMAAAKIEHTTRLVEKVVADLRNLSKTLDPENISDIGLVSIIKFELELLEKTGVYRTSFEVSGQEKRLSAQHELLVYRIIQESLNNIIKHAKAGLIKIILNFSDAQLEITITDDGIGFDMVSTGEKDIYKSGAGLKNMKKRANLTGGSFNIKSVPSGGTTILMTIPLGE